MKIRKLISLSLALTLLFALAACGSGDSGSSNSPNPSQSAPESQSPEQSPSNSPEPSDSPEAPAQGGDVDLQAFYESFTGNEEFAANTEVVDDFLAMCYPGMSDIATKQRVIYQPMMSGVVCELALVEVENAADVDAVKDIFQARIDEQVETILYPDSVEGWKNDSRIVSNGNYVMMVAWWGHADEVVDAFNALF